MADIKFIGYKPEFIESSKYFPFIQDAIKNDRLYSPQEIDNLLQQATQIASEEDIYAKFYIDVVYSVDGQQKRHHGIRADIDGEYSKGDFMPIHDEIWSYLEDAAKKGYYKVERKSKMKESYNRYAKETDIEFLKDALAEMRRYERMWDSMSARQKRDIAPEGGLEELQQNIEYAEQRLAELEGAQNEGKQVDEKDYKWKKLKYIKNGQVYGKVGRRIGIAAPTTLPSSEGPIPGPGAEGGGDCGGCSESKLSEAVNAEFTEDELEGLLNLVNNFVAEVQDKYISTEDSLGMREVRNTVYGVFDAIYKYLKKEYPDSKLIQKYNLQESIKKCLKEEVDGARTLQEWFENNELDGADVYDSDFDLDGTYVDNIVTPADNYDRFTLYVCNNVEIVEGDANRSYATVDFSGFVRNNMQALLQWLDIDEQGYEDGLEDDDLYEDIISQIIAALQGYGSESQYREFMRIIGQ